MSIQSLHPWTDDPDEATRLQEVLRERLVLAWDGRQVRTIGGVDVSYTVSEVHAAILTLHYPGLTPQSTATAEAPIVFPYIPGLLAFRIGPAILAAWENLERKPEVLLFHGHGIAHPRGIGLASQMGLWLEIPTIGVARRKLYGNHQEVGAQPGDWSELLDDQDPSRVIGAVVRTREATRAIYVSPGHLIDSQRAVEFVLMCCRSNRMPEPIRLAHKVAAAHK